MPVPRIEHVAGRPTWNCRHCGWPWPCPIAKNDLAEQYHGSPSGLTVFMASCMYEALEDLTTSAAPVPVDLFERFISWTRPAP
jgi:hypothetical protein